jgi:hypothetical protein
MSYRYGLNGNDLNWDEIQFLNCFYEDLELALHRGEIELDEDGNIPDDVIDGVIDGNPTMIYYKGDILDIQQLLSEDKKLDDVLDWFIVHDTNGNFVYFVGDVPDDYLTEEYIKERNEAEGE